MAVIVQVMIDAKTSGVLFTSNPISDEENIFLIESNFGLGESVVSGKAITDQFTVKRKSEENRESFEILTREIGTKSIFTKSKVVGVEEAVLPEEKKNKKSLLNRQRKR